MAKFEVRGRRYGHLVVEEFDTIEEAIASADYDHFEGWSDQQEIWSDGVRLLDDRETDAAAIALLGERVTKD